MSRSTPVAASGWRGRSTGAKLLARAALGIVATVITGLTGSRTYAVAVGWAAAALLFCMWVSPRPSVATTSTRTSGRVTRISPSWHPLSA